MTEERTASEGGDHPTTQTIYEHAGQLLCRDNPGGLEASAGGKAFKS